MKARHLSVPLSSNVALDYKGPGHYEKRAGFSAGINIIQADVIMQPETPQQVTEHIYTTSATTMELQYGAIESGYVGDLKVDVVMPNVLAELTDIAYVHFAIVVRFSTPAYESLVVDFSKCLGEAWSKVYAGELDPKGGYACLLNAGGRALSKDLVFGFRLSWETASATSGKLKFALGGSVTAVEYTNQLKRTSSDELPLDETFELV